MSPAAFCCPVCGSALAFGAGALHCCKGHSFDVAKEGYVNLLLASRMHSKAPGDSKEMLAARHALLQSGAYSLFAQTLGEICAGLCAKKGGPARILDAGCGEGYYDEAVCAALAGAGVPHTLAGFDIAKAGVRLAAKRAIPAAQFAVASSFAVPVQAGWANVLLNIFSPFANAEFLRCLAPGGHLIYAVPTARHLMGLKAVLYDQPYENPVEQIDYTGFAQVGERVAETGISLQGEQVQQLFAMTPYYWKTPADGAARLAALQSLDTPIGFRFLIFQKTG